MTTPGPDDRPGTDVPGQPGQPTAFGLPPTGQPPQPGQPLQSGPPQQFGQQPPWVGEQAPGQAPPEPGKSRTQKVLAIAGAAVVGAVAVVGLFNLLGGGAPEIGDCISQAGVSEFETVDCDSDDAQYRVVGTDDDMTEADFEADPDTCFDVAEATVALWSGTDMGVPGQVFCAAPV